MKMKNIVLIIALTTLSASLYSQRKTVILDVSHEVDTAYTKVNPQIFEQYKELVGQKIDANLIINKKKELDDEVLTKTDLLIVLSPLDRNRETPKNNLTPIERKSIVNYVKEGGKLIIFMDEENRVDMESFGGNDILKPLGMEYGLDLPMQSNIGATSIISEAIKQKYELSYSGSRSLTGGTPISYKNGEEKLVHGAYVKLNNGGIIVAFGETMTSLFMGGITMTLPNGTVKTWQGKDDRLFIQHLIKWLLDN